KDKQTLTINGKQVLLLSEHSLLYENLKKKYPERNLDSIILTNNNDNSNNTDNQSSVSPAATNESIINQNISNI
ncbi:unnamed protein product, partial [Adineta steineri]